MIWLRLFWTFFKIGLFGFGGGYGMLSLIQNEVVEKQVITTQYKYDAADAGTMRNALKLAEKLDGQAVMFDSLNGDIF